MKLGLTIAACLLSSGAVSPHHASLDLVDRALRTPAYVLANRGDLPDQLAAAIDIAYGLNGARANPSFAALFDDDFETHGALMHAWQRAGFSKDDFGELRACLKMLSSQGVAPTQASCGDQLEYKRLSAAWTEAEAKPIDQQNPAQIFEFRIFLDDKWIGTTKCAEPACADKPIAFEIVHFGPNGYGLFMADGTRVDGYYDPDSRTLSTSPFANSTTPKITLQMSLDGTTVTGTETDADGRPLRYFNLSRSGWK